MLRKILTIGGPSVVALAVGSFGGYLLANKRLSKGFAEALEVEVKAAKEYYRKLYKVETFATVEAAAEAIASEVQKTTPAIVVPNKPRLDEVVGKLKYHTLPPVATKKPESQVLNIFKSETRGYDIPDDDRSDKEPYSISFEEFNDGEVGYPQSTLTYYTVDEVLTDEDDDPIDTVNTLVGVKNLGLFGTTPDPNAIYIRNEKLGNDFEIVRVQASYKSHVIGLSEDAALGGDDG